MYVYRWVRMSFIPERINEFLEIFDRSKEKIRAFPGCISLSLFRDLEKENVMYTWSLWRSKADLEAYRKSELFQVTWQQTKQLFNEPPMAHSLILQEGETKR